MPTPGWLLLIHQLPQVERTQGVALLVRFRVSEPLLVLGAGLAGRGLSRP